MNDRTSPLFDASRSALLLLAAPAAHRPPLTSPTLPPNAMRANDLPTDGFDRETAPWTA
jgi:hypothetical protein